MNATYTLGFAVAVCSSAAYSTAVTLQAWEARRSDGSQSMRLSLIPQLARRPRWAAGVAIGVVAWGLHAAAFRIAPLTLVEPALAFTLVLLLLSASVFLGERLRPTDWLGIPIISIGVVVLTVVVPQRHGPGGSEWLKAATLTVIAAAAVAPYLAHGRRRAVLPVSAGVAYAGTALATKFAIDALSTSLIGSVLWLGAAAALGVVGILAESSSFQTVAAHRAVAVIFGLSIGIPVVLASLLVGEPLAGWPTGLLTEAAALSAVLTGIWLVSRSAALPVAAAARR